MLANQPVSIRPAHAEKQRGAYDLDVRIETSWTNSCMKCSGPEFRIADTTKAPAQQSAVRTMGDHRYPKRLISLQDRGASLVDVEIVRVGQTESGVAKHEGGQEGREIDVRHTPRQLPRPAVANNEEHATEYRQRVGQIDVQQYRLNRDGDRSGDRSAESRHLRG